MQVVSGIFFDSVTFFCILTVKNGGRLRQPPFGRSYSLRILKSFRYILSSGEQEEKKSMRIS